MNPASIDYLTTLPWYAVSDPDEPTPIHDALAAERAPRLRGADGRFVKRGRA
jgi:hypothetical protein